MSDVAEHTVVDDGPEEHEHDENCGHDEGVSEDTTPAGFPRWARILIVLAMIILIMFGGGELLNTFMR